MGNDCIRALPTLSRRGTRRYARIAVVCVALSAAVFGMSGCASLVAAATTPPAPPPEPSYASEMLEERPLPPIRVDGLSQEEVQDVTVYRDTVRAVVNISTVRPPTGRIGGFSGAIGSGFIIDDAASVVTNYHVVEDATRVVVTLYDGSSYRGHVTGFDPEMDLAVIRFDPIGRSLTKLAFADSSTVQVGQTVYALGSPFGLEGTLTKGIVSGLNRPIPSESGFIIRNLIQTDASINTGNSGGPLLDSAGNVIGVNVLIFSPSGGSVGVGFAIPSNGARRVVESIISDGRVERGWIEISGVTVSPRLAEYAGFAVRGGVLVTTVWPNGNADTAGLRDGSGGPYLRYGLSDIPLTADIIVAVDGAAVESSVELLSLLEPTTPGDTVTLTVFRDGARSNVDITLTERPGT